MGAGLVQLGNQGFGKGYAGRVGRTQNEGVAARLGNQCGLKRTITLARSAGGAAPRIQQAQHQRCQVHSDSVLDGNDFHVGGVGDVHGRNDQAQAPQVVAIVGDDE